MVNFEWKEEKEKEGDPPRITIEREENHGR
jgi:hypothetical protein